MPRRRPSRRRRDMTRGCRSNAPDRWCMNRCANPGRFHGGGRNALMTARIEKPPMPSKFRVGAFLSVLAFSLSLAVPALADYAGEISAYRRAHGLSAVRLDG